MPSYATCWALSLDDAGYAVHAADGGSAALSWLEQGERVDIIVSDLTMPAMDGLTLIRLVQERRANLPAILLTGYAGDGAALAVGGAISGAFSLLRKPVSGTQLVDRINALLASRRQPSSVLDAAPASSRPNARRSRGIRRWGAASRRRWQTASGSRSAVT